MADTEDSAGAVAYSSGDGIATIRLNRPEKLNAVDAGMIAALVAAVDRAEADDAVRAIVIAGNGRIFCAGADMSAGDKTFDYDNQDGAADRSPVRADGSIDYADPGVRDGAGLLTLRLYRCHKPVIGAIHGAAVGVGVTMTLAMDVRLAAEGTRFGFVFTQRGIVPEGASSWFLPRIVGLPTALDWCLSGRMIPAEEALAKGLVRSLHRPEELLAAATEYARDLVANTAPVSVALTRQMLWRLAGAEHPMEAHRMDSRGVYARGRTDDAREGVASFLEKRAPLFPVASLATCRTSTRGGPNPNTTRDSGSEASSPRQASSDGSDANRFW